MELCGSVSTIAGIQLTQSPLTAPKAESHAQDRGGQGAQGASGDAWHGGSGWTEQGNAPCVAFPKGQHVDPPFVQRFRKIVRRGVLESASKGDVTGLWRACAQNVGRGGWGRS